MTDEKVAKVYFCENCNYKCFNKTNFDKHLATRKHKNLQNTDEKVALVHFSVISRSAFVSVNLSPEMRGKRLSKLCLGAAINYFSNQYSQVTILNAEIKSLNIASQRVFESVGFFRLQEIIIANIFLNIPI